MYDVEVGVGRSKIGGQVETILTEMAIYSHERKFLLFCVKDELSFHFHNTNHILKTKHDLEIQKSNTYRKSQERSRLRST